MLSLSETLDKISPHTRPHPSVTVAILDTGILACHGEFKDKIVAMKNFVPNEAVDLCYDSNGHGTSCAGIVLRTTPFVRLVVCKVVSCRGTGQLKWAADAIDWLLKDETGPKNYCPVDIISMSFGCISFDSDFRRAVSEAVACGKVVVAAASNDGRKRLTNIAFPARFGDVICVGSCNNLGQPSSFTPTGREIDFLAPGEDIQAPSSAGFDQFRNMSGTSEATPTVAGIAAMVISYAETIGGQEMRSAVSHTAVMREILRKMASMPGHHDEHMGYGNLDPMRLFKYGPDHFRQVVEDIVGPLPVLQPARRDAETQTLEFIC
ncbi:subtilisin DY-like isoform X2 [Branchiostoma floridae]|uniref:Subtilisin DY-like isoform X2 n=1 Tax=Branchiostoma floridae TaxID=7739 RepID=A0A9J7NDE8_BRAFL|nr:subtilisin DY-like isoform X2 [Branchiostoma floridae]